MGKRSDFKRVEKDFYRTPIEAVRPLMEHIDGIGGYIEPCCGDNALENALWSLSGPDCVLASDDEVDARTTRYQDIVDTSMLFFPDAFITNPPWTRSILHPIIENLCHQLPTWLLFDADWMHTKQSAPYMGWCQKIVSVGRVKWFPDSKHVGKDNCCWYLFAATNESPTEFHGREE